MISKDNELIKRLEEKAYQIRKDLLIYCRNIDHSHLGGPLSMCDIAVALLYHFMKYDPKNYAWPERDRLILSKGHCACLFYNIFSDMGMFTKEELYREYNKVEGRFGQHPNRKYLPMFEASTGALGHGLPLAFGYAMAGRMDNAKWRVFCLVGDGELDEGSNWEAILAIAHYQLGNLVLVVDRNHYNGTRSTEETLKLDSVEKKFEAFNWDVRSINGNDMSQVVEALSALPPNDAVTRRTPIVIIADTIKGKGVSFMEENAPSWHLGALDDAKLQEALTTLEASRK